MISVFQKNRRPFVAIAMLAFALVLAGCQAQLAPSYDKSIVDKLGQANLDGMTLFEKAGQNLSSPQGYNTLQPSYTALVALLEATKVEIDSRPVPSTPPGHSLLGKPISDIQSWSSPSSGVVALLSKTISTMRDAHAKAALTPAEVQVFKGQYVISMQQALIYEKALAR